MKFGSYRISIDTRPRAKRPSARRPPLVKRGLLGGGIAFALLLGTAPYAFAASTGPVTATIYAQAPATYSITVSPTAIGFCSAGSPLTYPVGNCSYGNLPVSGPVTGGVTITNTGAAGNIDVNGSNAVPSDGVTADDWVLTNVSGGPPGPNQYGIYTESNYSGGSTQFPVIDTPGCDLSFSGSDSCVAASGQSQEEALLLVGPQSTTDTSSTFSTTMTWTAGP